MNFINVDSRRSAIANANITTNPHGAKSMYLDEFLDNTFITDYVLLTKSNGSISSSPHSPSQFSSSR